MIEVPAGGAQPAQPEASAVQMADRVQMVVRQAAQIQSSAQSFAASAGSGFHIEPQAAATLINACRDSINELDQVQTHLRSLQQSPPLGETPGAKVVAPFTQSVATDPQGIYPAIQNLVKTLQDMIQAYQKASTDYAETEAIVQASMRQQAANLK